MSPPQVLRLLIMDLPGTFFKICLEEPGWLPNKLHIAS